MNTKTCSRCNRELPYESYNARQDSADGLQARCKRCLRDVRREWYAVNQKTEYARIKKAASEKRQWWIEFKATLKCERCPENHPACLDFHHTDPGAKDINLAQAYVRGWSVTRIQKELAKCIVLCSNCHRKSHDELRHNKQTPGEGSNPSVSVLTTNDPRRQASVVERPDNALTLRCREDETLSTWCSG